MYSLIKGMVFYIPTRFIKFNKFVYSILDLPEKTSKTFNYCTKVGGAALGAKFAAKGTVDLTLALAECDYMCAAVSSVGICCDALQICSSFVPGPNVSMAYTFPISCFCKQFVHECRTHKLKWGGCP